MTVCKTPMPDSVLYRANKLYLKKKNNELTYDRYKKKKKNRKNRKFYCLPRKMNTLINKKRRYACFKDGLRKKKSSVYLESSNM